MSLSNQQWFERAQQVIPGGVNSPVRAFRGVGGNPPFIDRGQGAYLWDAENKCYIDYVGSWGPLILGHAHPVVVAAVKRAAEQGLSYGAPTAGEVELAEWLCEHLPSIEQVRLVSSGTEATMSAIRLARGATGRSKIIKFEGCYHGHADALLVKAGSGALTFGQPNSAGVPPETAMDTLVLPYNHIEGLVSTFEQCGKTVAAVIVEPVAGNMNLIRPAPTFLQTLRDLCSQYGAILIFDEVMTGFRVGLQGAQGLFEIRPDLTTLGKIVGGGMPLAAFGGKREIMEYLAPLGSVYQAGTLSGNPVAVAAGMATLRLLEAPGFYDHLTELTANLVERLSQAAAEIGVPFCAQSIGGMFGFYFTQVIPTNYQEVMASDVGLFNRFFHGMLAEGIYLAPSAFEAGFVSVAHTVEDIELTYQAARRVFKQLKQC